MWQRQPHRSSPGLVLVRSLALGAEVVLITSAAVGGKRRVARKRPLFVAPIVALKFRRPR
eukprot:14680441-Alexandrium_andersonii.AAC.1